jgi:hypothetical protein
VLKRLPFSTGFGLPGKLLLDIFIELLIENSMLLSSFIMRSLKQEKKPV